ncbi:MAG: hypothetical protein ACR2PX_10960 [Endozoicomonas sp.]|uniref:hypothetical protein n=1 Tax=Endozoicomonas sp. TaxID=1892382 RepID=UPI003D9B289A
MEEEPCIIIDGRFVYAPDNVSVDTTEMAEALASTRSRPTRAYVMIAPAPEEGADYHFTPVAVASLEPATSNALTEPDQHEFSAETSQLTNPASVEPESATSSESTDQQNKDSEEDSDVPKPKPPANSSSRTSSDEAPTENSPASYQIRSKSWQLKSGSLESTHNPFIRQFLESLLAQGYEIVHGSFFYSNSRSLSVQEFNRLAQSLTAYLHSQTHVRGYPHEAFILMNDTWMSILVPYPDTQPDYPPGYPSGVTPVYIPESSGGATPGDFFQPAQPFLSVQPLQLLWQINPFAASIAQLANADGYFVIYLNTLYVPELATYDINQIIYLYQLAVSQSAIPQDQWNQTMRTSTHSGAVLTGFQDLNIFSQLPSTQQLSPQLITLPQAATPSEQVAEQNPAASVDSATKAPSTPSGSI